MDYSQNAHKMRQNGQDAAAQIKTDKENRQLFPTVDFYGTDHRYIHYHEPVGRADGATKPTF